MGQALTSCAPCCSSAQAYEDEDSYQKVSDIGTNDNNRQWMEKIKTSTDKVVLAVDPKSSEEEIAADRMKILMNLGTETWKEWITNFTLFTLISFLMIYYWSRNKIWLILNFFNLVFLFSLTARTEKEIIWPLKNFRFRENIHKFLDKILETATFYWCHFSGMANNIVKEGTNHLMKKWMHWFDWCSQ